MPTDMGFFSRISTIGNRTLARTIAEQFAEEYIKVKNTYQENSRVELIRATLGQLTKWPVAQNMLSTGFLDDEDHLDLSFVVYYMVTESSPINKHRLFIPARQIDAYTEEIANVLKEHGLDE